MSVLRVIAPSGIAARDLVWFFLGALSLMGCHHLLPYSSARADTSTNTTNNDASAKDTSTNTTNNDISAKDTDYISCEGPPESCWDVSAQFFKSDYAYYPLQIFGTIVTNNQIIYAMLAGQEDNTYTEPMFTCDAWGPGNTENPRPRTWNIERKKIDDKTYRILAHGASDTDCNKGRPVCSGEIVVNAVSGWRITKNEGCYVTEDNQGAQTYCTVDLASGRVAWASGSTCGGCCACPDGASISISFLVAKQ